jgi:hypothetical protein
MNGAEMVVRGLLRVGRGDRRRRCCRDRENPHIHDFLPHVCLKHCRAAAEALFVAFFKLTFPRWPTEPALPQGEYAHRGCRQSRNSTLLIISKMRRNRSRGTATSAIWKMV